MALLGLILIVVAVALGALLFIAAQPLTDPARLEALGVQANVQPLVLILAGAAVVLLLWLGWAMLRAGVRHKARRRRETKELQRQAERDAQARRDAEARAAAATGPSHRVADADQRADARAEQGRGDYRDGRLRDDDLHDDSGRHHTPKHAASNDEDRPTVADRIMGRKDHDSRG